MEQSSHKELRSYRPVNLALLALRLIIATIILLHNISKLQEYNQIIEGYESMWGIGGALWFLLIASVEVGCALLIIIGLWVRFAAGVLLTGSVAIIAAYFHSLSTLEVELQGLYSVIYIVLLIGGGGLYSLDSLFGARRFGGNRV